MSDGHLTSSKCYVEMGQTKERYRSFHYNDNCYVCHIKINPIVSECTCVFYTVHATYLFYTSQPSNNSIASQLIAEFFIFEQVKGFTF